MVNNYQKIDHCRKKKKLIKSLLNEDGGMLENQDNTSKILNFSGKLIMIVQIKNLGSLWCPYI